MARASKSAQNGDSGASPLSQGATGQANGSVDGERKQSGAGNDPNGVAANAGAVASGSNGINDPEKDGGAIPPKKRGRHPSGCNCDKCQQRRANPQAKTEVDLNKPISVRNDRNKVFGNIMMLHNMGSLWLGPSIQIAEEEGRVLSTALCDWADYYKIDLCGEATGPYFVWLGLISAIGTVYGKKVLMVIAAKKAANKSATVAATPGAAFRQAPVNFGNDVVNMQ